MGYTRPKNKAGKAVPSVTGIIGNRKQVGGLMHWAWKIGSEGKDYRDERDQAASGGHYAHSKIEFHIKGITMDAGGYNEEAAKLGEAGYAAYLTWEQQTKLEIKHSEVILCHEGLQYGGTLDAIGRCDGRLALLDWKCANGTYLEHVIQLAAYREMWNENNPDFPVEECHLLRIGKEFSDFHHHHWPMEVLDKAFTMFLHMHQLYLLDKELKNVAS